MTQRHVPTCREVFKRIGETYESNLLWLAQFASMPLKPLEESKRVEVLENVFAFCLLYGSAEPAHWHKRPLYSLWSMDSPAIIRKRWREVESLQVVTRDAVDAAALRQALRLPKLQMTLEIDFSKWKPGQVQPTAPEFWFRPPFHPEDEWWGAFIYRLACILVVEGDRLAQCQSETCRQPLRLFLRSKSDQLFCSNTCRSRDAMRKKRKEDREEAMKQNRKEANTTQRRKMHATTR
jgi:hypothetical protein